MPITKSLSKVQKSVEKTKAAIHPRGRKFRQLARATLREEKIADKKQKHNEKRSNELARYRFMQEVISQDAFKEKLTFGLEEMKAFAEAYVSRDDEALEKMNKERRADRPPTNKHLLLQEKIKHEKHEFDVGFLMPDLSDVKTVGFLRAWNGTFGGINTMKNCRVSKDMVALPTKEITMTE